ncbi:NAD(P)H-dependent oxidoreductase [Streptococcus fryi]
MTTVLLVKGHPLDVDSSYSIKLLETFKQRYAAVYPETEFIELDVYKENIPDLDKDFLDSLTRQKKGEVLSDEEQSRLNDFNRFSEQLLAVDKVVIANPLWNMFLPSRLLMWINALNVVGKTFRYTAEGPIGLVKGKKLLHIQANGGIYKGQDAGATYVKSIFNFLGIDDIETLYFEGHAYDPSNAATLYEDALARLDNIVEHF